MPPGLYAMHITDRKGADGQPAYEVSFEERRLEDVVKHLNRMKRADEKPFEAVAAVSDFNQRAYERFARPLVEAWSSEIGGEVQRAFHPLRVQRWAFSDLNPALWWLKPAAEMVKKQRAALPADHPMRRSEKAMAELTSAALDFYRAVRDASSEARFFELYGNMFGLYMDDGIRSDAEPGPQDPRQLPIVKEALASIDHGGYAEAAARAAILLARKGEPLPLSRLDLKKELISDYKDLLPPMTLDQARRVRGEQELIVRFEPEQALATLPHLLHEQADRDRLVRLLETLLADQRVQKIKPQPEQLQLLQRIRDSVGAGNGAARTRRRPSRAQHGASR
jgi:hypothetical protein